MANAETTKAMQEALQSAVSRLNTGGGGGPAVPGELITAAMAILPKLLQNSGAGEEMLERLDTLQKGDLATLREQVQTLRGQCRRIIKCQEDLLGAVQEIQRQQVAAAGAVLDLAQQMSRITFIDDPEVGEDDRDMETPAPPAIDYRAGSHGGGNGAGTRHSDNAGRVRPQGRAGGSNER